MSSDSSDDATGSSVSAGSSGSSATSRSRRSDESGDGAAAPPIIHCNDYACCNANGNTSCDSTTMIPCPGWQRDPTMGTPSKQSTGGIVHPSPGTHATCSDCRLHDQQNPPKQQQIGVEDYGQRQGIASVSQLCKRCIDDEVDLYWAREATPLPTGPCVGPSLAHVVQWPVVAGSDQDLCICVNWCVTRCQDLCHRCRNRKWKDDFLNEKIKAEAVLWEHTRPAIRGDHGFIALTEKRWKLQQRHINQRINNRIQRACPCGEKPKAPDANEYITYCMACMGVKITVANLPIRYQQRQTPLRRSARLAGQNAGARAWAVTKGRHRAQRNPNFRVNMERGWEDWDHYIGGGF